jgi:hypothetical protein
MTQAVGLPDGARLSVDGHPTPAQLAAVLLALDQAAAADASAATVPTGSPAWARAAHLEALGHRPLAAPADLVDPGAAASRP